MAEQPAAEKTEQPTQRKLKKAREKGQVARSEELPASVCIVALMLGLALLGPSMLGWMTEQMKDAMAIDNSVFSSGDRFTAFFNSKIIGMVFAISPLLLFLTVGSVLACIVISGFNYSTQALAPKPEAINPIEGAKKLIDVRALVKLGISIAKMVVVALIVYFYMRDRLDEMTRLRYAWTSEIIAGIASLCLGMLIRICVALIPIAVIDAIYQHWKYIQELKMTKQEVKEEHRDSDGSPEVKSRIRQLQTEMVRKRMLQEVPKADVVLTNPTHVAVALKYNPGEMDCPMVVAKGADLMAEKVREIARGHGVPIVRRPELARTLYSSVEPGQPIPQNLFVAVAEILAMIYRMKGKGGN